MINLTPAQLQTIIYNGMRYAVEKYVNRPPADIYADLNAEAAKMALAADNSPIDLERIASVL